MRGVKFRIYPTADQAVLFEQFAGVCRLVYNLAWEQRRDFWRQFRSNTGRPITFASQCRELTALRSEFDWVEAVPRVCLEQALRDLDGAFSRFLRGASGYPSPRKKSINDSFRFKGGETEVRQLNDKWAEAWVPKAGWVKFRITRPVTEIRNATISSHAGAWFIAFSVEVERQTTITPSAQVGIDRGVTNAIALSTGEMFFSPASLQVLDRRRRKAQRVLARRKRGSRRHARQRARVAALSAQTARVRRDWLHRTSTYVARRFGLVAMEKLRVANMTRSAAGTLAEPGKNVAQKRGLNRSILAQSWTQFATMLAYKLEERGGALVFVDPRFTSQTCQACGVVDAQSRKSQAVFECVACGHRDHADTNAALEILRRSTAWLDVEGHHFRPAEASTSTAA